MAKLRIVLADDHAVVRDGVKRLINAQPDMEVIGEAADGPGAWEQTCALQPDILVLDLAMPGLDGVTVSTRLQHACPGVKILFLTMHEEASYQVQAQQTGAAGYVLKRGAAEELAPAIRTVAAGGRYWPPPVSPSAPLSAGRVAPALGPGRAPLRGRAEAILRRVAAGQSNQEIAAALGLSVPAVETTKTRLMRQLGLASRAAVVRYAEQQGWRADGTLAAPTHPTPTGGDHES